MSKVADQITIFDFEASYGFEATHDIAHPMEERGRLGIASVFHVDHRVALAGSVDFIPYGSSVAVTIRTR